MPVATAGVQSTLDVESNPVIGNGSGLMSQSYAWTWAWFVLAVFIVVGFHIRLFGHPIPPAANFP